MYCAIDWLDALIRTLAVVNNALHLLPLRRYPFHNTSLHKRKHYNRHSTWFDAHERTAAAESFACRIRGQNEFVAMPSVRMESITSQH